MHSDTSRLLQDCDGTIGRNRPSVFKNSVTRDLSYHVHTTHWMAKAVYRLYDASEEGRGLVEGITIDFSVDGLFNQPLLIVGQVLYVQAADASVTDACKQWDLWEAFFNWSAERTLKSVLMPESQDTGRIEWVKLMAVPLYEIEKMADVERLMQKVREHQT